MDKEGQRTTLGERFASSKIAERHHWIRGRFVKQERRGGETIGESVRSHLIFGRRIEIVFPKDVPTTKVGGKEILPGSDMGQIIRAGTTESVFMTQARIGGARGTTRRRRI